MLNNIKDLEIGKTQEIQLLIKNAEQAKTRTGEMYQKLVVRDANEHEIVMFNFKEQITGNFPIVIKATVDTSEYKESACTKLLSFQLDSQSKPEEFLPKAQVDSKKLLNELAKYQKSIRLGLRKIVASILNENRKTFVYYPFSKTGIFSRTSGILEATLRLTMLAEQTAVTTGLDRDLMIAGAMLYYIGKTQTIDNSYNYTEDDVLMGAGLTAALTVQMKVKEILSGDDEEAKAAIDIKDVKLLTHILSSRFKGIPSATPEACALRYLDALVTETEAIKNIQKENEPGTVVSDRNIYGNRVYCY